MNEAVSYFKRLNHGRSGDGSFLNTVYLGAGEGLTYIAPFIEDLLLTEHGGSPIAPIDPQQLEAEWQAIDADLGILVAPASVVARLARSGDLCAVARIHQVVDTSQGLAPVHALMSSRERKRSLQALENGYSYDISHQDDDFFEFYRTMHAPTMEARYGDRARSVEERKALETLFHQGALFRVFRNGQWVAGSVGQLDRATRTLNSRLIGVLAGDDRLRLEGAQNFVYHAILNWAAEQPDVDRVDFQGCEPFLTKGTFQYKKRFGTRAELPANQLGRLRMLLRPRISTPAIRAFLIDNPVLCEGAGGELVAHYFFDANRPARTDLPFASPGISGACYTDLGLT